MARTDTPLIICGLRHLVAKNLLSPDETLPARSIEARLVAWCDLDLPREAVTSTLAAACLESGRRGYLASEIIGALGEGGMLDRLENHLRAQRVRCPVRVSVVDVDLDDFRTFNALAVTRPWSLSTTTRPWSKRSGRGFATAPSRINRPPTRSTAPPRPCRRLALRCTWRASVDSASGQPPLEREARPRRQSSPGPCRRARSGR